MNAEPASIHDFPSGETFPERQYIIRFKRVKALGTKYREANAEWKRVFHECDQRLAPRGSEQFYRDEVAKHSAWSLLNDAEKAYRAACDEFFQPADISPSTTEER